MKAFCYVYYMQTHPEKTNEKADITQACASVIACICISSWSLKISQFLQPFITQRGEYFPNALTIKGKWPWQRSPLTQPFITCSFPPCPLSCLCELTSSSPLVSCSSPARRKKYLLFKQVTNKQTNILTKCKGCGVRKPRYKCLCHLLLGK